MRVDGSLAMVAHVHDPRLEARPRLGVGVGVGVGVWVRVRGWVRVRVRVRIRVRAGVRVRVRVRVGVGVRTITWRRAKGLLCVAPRASAAMATLVAWLGSRLGCG